MSSATDSSRSTPTLQSSRRGPGRCRGQCALLALLGLLALVLSGCAASVSSPMDTAESPVADSEDRWRASAEEAAGAAEPTEAPAPGSEAPAAPEGPPTTAARSDGRVGAAEVERSRPQTRRREEADRALDEATESPFDELWVIERSAEPSELSYATAEDAAGGEIVASVDGETRRVAASATSVYAEVEAHAAVVEVAQTFRQPFDREARVEYRFRLPRESAVDDFAIRLGERHIRAIIRERAAAQRVFELARERGYVTTLFEQGGADVFRWVVERARPGATILVELRYVGSLARVEGRWELAVPLPKAPAALGSSVRLRARVTMSAPLVDVLSPTHEIAVTRSGRTRARVELETRGSEADRFVLRLGVATESVDATAWARRSGDVTSLALIVTPGSDDSPLEELEVDWGETEVSGLTRRESADGTVVWRGRARGPLGSPPRIRGRRGGESIERAVEWTVLDPVERAIASRDALVRLWARARVGDLLSQADDSEARSEALRLALEHGVLCPLTAFVAVDALSRGGER